MIEPRHERLVELRLKLPRTQVTSGVVPRIEIDERICRAILEIRRSCQALDIQFLETIPAHLAAVRLNFVDEFGAIASQVMQFFETGEAKIVVEVARSDFGVAL